MTREVVFKMRVITESDGDGWHAYCPALKGVHAPGDTEQEAIRNIANAAVAYLMSIIKHGDPIPLGFDVTVKQPLMPRRIYQAIFPPRTTTQDVTIQVPGFAAA